MGCWVAVLVCNTVVTTGPLESRLPWPGQTPLARAPGAQGPRPVIRREDEIIASDNNPSDTGAQAGGPGCVCVRDINDPIDDWNLRNCDARSPGLPGNSADTVWTQCDAGGYTDTDNNQARPGENGGRRAHLRSR